MSKGSEIAKGFYKSGKARFITPYFNNNKHGLLQNFYPNGNRHYECLHQNGRKEGIEYMFYESGSVASETPFQRGAKHGTASRYYPDGKLLCSEVYKNDRKDGLEKVFHPNGDYKEITLFKNDVEICTLPICAYKLGNFFKRIL
ncbi:toxin-antitoxin system YwqK family antitoxin [Spirosoma litoris]